MRGELEFVCGESSGATASSRIKNAYSRRSRDGHKNKDMPEFKIGIQISAADVFFQGLMETNSSSIPKRQERASNQKVICHVSSSLCEL